MRVCQVVTNPPWGARLDGATDTRRGGRWRGASQGELRERDGEPLEGWGGEGGEGGDGMERAWRALDAFLYRSCPGELSGVQHASRYREGGTAGMGFFPVK
jgi:hypothetical protein